MAVPAARELTVAPPPAPANPQTPSLPSPYSAPDPLPEPPAVAYHPSPTLSDKGSNADPHLVEEPTVPRRSTRTRRLARRVRDLMTGEGVTAVTNDDDVNEAGVVSLDTPPHVLNFRVRRAGTRVRRSQDVLRRGTRASFPCRG
jgi:hypothetical protein